MRFSEAAQAANPLDAGRLSVRTAAAISHRLT